MLGAGGVLTTEAGAAGAAALAAGGVAVAGGKPAASDGSCTVAGNCSGGLRKASTSTSSLEAASAKSATRYFPSCSTTVPMGSPGGNNPPSPDDTIWSPARRVTIWDSVSKDGMAVLSPTM